MNAAIDAFILQRSLDTGLKKDEDMSTSKQQIAELRLELDKYRVTVKQLSFDLEMARGHENRAENVKAIRRIALEQAAELVMDCGLPQTGSELEDLCRRITELPETNGGAIERALAAMGYGEKRSA